MQTFGKEAASEKIKTKALFESLKGEELFWLDLPDGRTVWRWTTE
jgi:hypothetical protein